MAIARSNIMLKVFFACVAFAYHGLQPDFFLVGLQPAFMAHEPRKTAAQNLSAKQWCAPHYQPPTEFRLMMPSGELSVWLASKRQAEDPYLYEKIKRSTGKEVKAVGIASGEGGSGHYPDGVKAFLCPMFHKGFQRSEGLLEFYDYCEETAAAGDAVIIHCNHSFHRGPLLLAALAKCAGHDKHETLEELATERTIYPGHLIDPSEWVLYDPDLRVAECLKEAHRFVDEKCHQKLVEDRKKYLARLRIEKDARERRGCERLQRRRPDFPLQPAACSQGHAPLAV